MILGSVGRFGWLAIASVYLSGCDAISFERDTAIGESSNGDDVVLDDSYWTLSETVDPFSDETGSSMTVVVEGDSLNTDVMVRCVGGSRLSYRFSTFKKDGRPQKISRFPNSNELQLLNPVEIIVFRARVDDRPPETGIFPEPRRSNSFVIGESTTLGGLKASELRLGNTLTLGIQYDEGEEVVVVDQSQPGFRAWLDGCSAVSGRSSHVQLEKPDSIGASDPNNMEAEQSADSDEFGGAIVGMLYDEFRERLISAGFQPVAVDPQERCDSGSGFVSCDYEYPETIGCMGTGEAYCEYEWSRDSDGFLVTTRDGEGGEVVEMSYIR